MNTITPTPGYPRLLRRVRAALIDTVLVALIVLGWWMSLPLVEGYSVFVTVAWPLSAWFILDPLLVWLAGGTPGHYFMNLRVLSAGSRQNIGLLRAIIRSLLKALTGWWSFIFVLMTRRHQAFHDLLSHSIVVLREPDLVAARERIPERTQDLDNYQYPSAVRRGLVMGTYIVLLVITVVVLSELTLSVPCLIRGRCGTLDDMVSIILSAGWFFGLALLLVYGWRSYLPGARRRRIERKDAT